MPKMSRVVNDFCDCARITKKSSSHATSSGASSSDVRIQPSLVGNLCICLLVSSSAIELHTGHTVLCFAIHLVTDHHSSVTIFDSLLVVFEFH